MKYTVNLKRTEWGSVTVKADDLDDAHAKAIDAEQDGSH